MPANRTRRMIYTGAIAAGLLTGAAALAGAATTSTQPAQPAASQQDQGPNEASEVPENESMSEADEAAALEAQAAITPDQARQAALDANPGGTVTDVQLGDEDGTVVYEVTMTDANGAPVEVKVDATDGTVLGQEAPDAEEDDGIDHQHEGEETGENGDGVPDADDATEAPASTPAG